MQCYTYTAWNWLNAVTDSGRLKHSKSEKRQMWRRPRAECSVPSAEGPKMVTTAAVLRDWTASQASAHTWQLPPATAPGPARGWVWSHPGWEGTPETGKAGHQLKTRMGAPVWASKPSELCARWRPSPHRWTCNSQCLRARSFVSILPTFTRSRCAGLSFQASLSTWLFQPASEMGGGSGSKNPQMFPYLYNKLSHPLY